MAVGGKSGSEVIKAARRRSDKVSQLCGNNPVGVIICVQKAQRATGLSRFRIFEWMILAVLFSLYFSRLIDKRARDIQELTRRV